MSGFDDTLTNFARPKTSATITVRVIKSFEFRTERSLVLRDIDLDTTTVGDLKDIARSGQTSLRLNELYHHSSHLNFFGLNSDPDSTGMETLPLCALWSVKSPLPQAVLGLVH